MIRLFQTALLLSSTCPSYLTFGFTPPLSPPATTFTHSQRLSGKVGAAASTSTTDLTTDYVLTASTVEPENLNAVSMPSPYRSASIAWAELRRSEIQEHHARSSTFTSSEKAVAGPLTLEEEVPPTVSKAQPRGLAYSKATVQSTSAPFLSTDSIEESEQETTTEQGPELRGLTYSNLRLALLEKKRGIVPRGLAYSKARLAMVQKGLAWNGSTFPSPPPTEDILEEDASVPEARGLSYSNARFSVSNQDQIDTMASATVASSPSMGQEEDQATSQHEEVESLMQVYTRGYY